MNDKVDPVIELIRQTRLVSVVRAAHVRDPAGLADVAISAGMPVLEITLTTARASEAIEEMADRGAVVGAGTVLTAAQAETVLEAGAHFIVSPVLEERVLAVARAAAVPVFPGAFSPTEVRRAAEAGASAVKVFPAGLGGAAYLRDLRLVFPDISLIPSGGVRAENAGDFLAAGALAVSVGTGSLAPALVEAGDNQAIAARFTEMAAAIAMAAAR